MRPVVLGLATALLGSACQPPVTTSATPSPAPTTAPIGSAAPTATAEPSPLPTARPGLRATTAAAIPASFRYVAIDLPLADGVRTRLWLVDLSGTRAPLVVAEWEAPVAPIGGWSASADGRVVVVSATGTRSRAALYLLRPETGDSRVVFEDAASIVISPRVAPDGQRVAFTRYPAAGGSDLGIWAVPVDGGAAERIAEPSTASATPAIPLAWSTESAVLAFTRDVSLERTEVHLVGRHGGPEIVVGEGDRASWRSRAPELLVSAPSSTGGRAYTFDRASGTALDVVTVPKLKIPLLQWHPTLDRFLYVEAEGTTREILGGIWVRNVDGSSPQRLDGGKTVFAPQWSLDGTLLTILAGGDDAVVPVVDLLSGRRITVLCRRGGKPPADCL